MWVGVRGQHGHSTGGFQSGHLSSARMKRKVVKDEGKPPGVFNAIFSIFVGYLSLQSAPWCTADVSFFRLISKPVPGHGETRDKRPHPAFCWCTHLWRLQWSFSCSTPSLQLFILKLFSESKQGHQNTDSYFILLSFTCQISEFMQFQFPLSYWEMYFGENGYHFLGIRETCIIFSPNKSKLWKRTLLTLSNTTFFTVS